MGLRSGPAATQSTPVAVLGTPGTAPVAARGYSDPPLQPSQKQNKTKSQPQGPLGSRPAHLAPWGGMQVPKLRPIRPLAGSEAQSRPWSVLDLCGHIRPTRATKCGCGRSLRPPWPCMWGRGSGVGHANLDANVPQGARNDASPNPAGLIRKPPECKSTMALSGWGMLCDIFSCTCRLVIAYTTSHIAQNAAAS